MGAHRSWAGRAALDAIKSHRRGCDSAKQKVHIQRFVVPCVAMQQCTECSSGPDPTGTADWHPDLPSRQSFPAKVAAV